MSVVALYCLIAFLLGGAVVYLWLRATQVSRKSYETLSQDLIRSEVLIKQLQNEVQTKQDSLVQLQDERKSLETSQDFLRDKNALVEAKFNSAQHRITELSDQVEKLETRVLSLTDDKVQLNKQVSELRAGNENLKEKWEARKEELNQLHETSRLQFEQIAAKIMEVNSKKFTEENREKLKVLLDPFRDNLDALKKTVYDTYDKEAKERFSLGEKVKELQELNLKISQDARDLTEALRGDSKTQGDWGEMILENILEKSGLTKGREYFLQQQLKDENGVPIRSASEGKKMQPDAIIHYPDNRRVIVDSKVSLTAFVEMTRAETDEEYRRCAKRHLISVRKHIDELSIKGYDDYDKSLDFVMMFLPSEPAYIAAMKEDPGLWQYAYDKRILLLSPTNLITSLKLISDLWKRDYQNKNAMEIAERAARLYDKLAGFVQNLQKVGTGLYQAQQVYDTAFKQLSSGRDNVLRQAQKLIELGVKPKKEMPAGLTEEAIEE